MKAGIQINPRGARFNLFPGRRKQKTEIPAHPSGWLIKHKTKISPSEGVEKGEPLCAAGGNANWCCRSGEQDVPQKVKKVPSSFWVHVRRT